MPRKHKRLDGKPKPRKSNPMAKALASPVFRPRMKPSLKRSKINEQRERDAEHQIREGDPPA